MPSWKLLLKEGDVLCFDDILIKIKDGDCIVINLHSPFFFYSYTFIFIFRYSLLPVEDCTPSSRKLVFLNIFSQRSFLNS